MTKPYRFAIGRFSTLVSAVFNPLFSLLCYFVWQSSKNYTFKETIHRFLPILFIVVVPVVVWIFWNIRTGRYSNADVSNREQRKTLYFFIEGVITVYLLFDYIRNSHLDLVMAFIFILLVMMQLSNYYIKSSMHTAFNILVAALFFSGNTLLGISWLLISAIVGVTRVILKRHTPREVLSGSIIGLVVSFLYLYADKSIKLHIF